MKHNYGLPYKGSKNTIAERIVQCLPSGGRFLDACCGGGAISHAAYLSGRYASITGYDINKSIITLLNAVMVEGGKIDYEHFPLITMEEFYEAKTRWDDGNLNDAVIRYTASFGFNGQDYLWGKDRLPYKYLMQKVVSLPTKFERREALRDLINTLNAAKIPYDSTEFKNLAHIELLFALLHLLSAAFQHLLLIIEHVLVHHDGQKSLDNRDTDVVLVAFQLQLRLFHIQLALLDFVGVAQPVEKGHAGVDAVAASPPYGFLVITETEILRCGRGHRRRDVLLGLSQTQLRSRNVDIGRLQRKVVGFRILETLLQGEILFSDVLLSAQTAEY